MMLAFSFVSTIQVRLPAGTANQSLVHLIGFVRDRLDCVASFNLSSVVVVPDSAQITNLVNNLQSSSSGINNNPIVQILSSGNQNTIGQVISSVSQACNQINDQTISTAVASMTLNNHFPFVNIIGSLGGIPASSITVSSLTDQTQQTTVSKYFMLLYHLINVE